MLKTEMAPCFAMLLLLIPTPTVADVTSDLARCELEAERIYPAPHIMPRIGQNAPPIYRNGPRISKRACGRPVIGSPQTVPRPLRHMKAA